MEFLSFNRIANDVCNEFLFYFIFDFLSNEAISTVRKECWSFILPCCHARVPLRPWYSKVRQFVFWLFGSLATGRSIYLLEMVTQTDLRKPSFRFKLAIARNSSLWTTWYWQFIPAASDSKQSLFAFPYAFQLWQHYIQRVEKTPSCGKGVAYDRIVSRSSGIWITLPHNYLKVELYWVPATAVDTGCSLIELNPFQLIIEYLDMDGYKVESKLSKILLFPPKYEEDIQSSLNGLPYWTI